MPFEFNQYSSLLLVVVLPSLLYAFLLLYRGYNRATLADKLTGILVLLFTLQATAWMLGFAGYYDQSGKTLFMFYFPWKHTFFYGPLVYLSFRSLTDKSFRLWRSPNWYHFLPGLLLLFDNVVVAGHDFLLMKVYLLDILPNDLEDAPGIWLNGLSSWSRWPLEILEQLSLFGYFIYTLLLYRRYRNYLQTNFSNDELVHLSWLRNFLAFFLLLIIAIPVIELLAENIRGMTTYQFSWYGYFLYGLIAYYLGFQAYANDPEDFRKIAFQPIGWPWKVARSGSSSSIDARPPTVDDEQAKLFQRIESTLSDKELHLQPTLSLQELANALGNTPAEISAAINGEAKTNFNFYINAWRVLAVQKKLLDPAYDHLSLLGIGLDAGFSSKATFNRAFKQHTGLTPRQFQKSQIAE